MTVELWLGDCLKILPEIDDDSIDAIMADLPYGVTDHACDCSLPLDHLWYHYTRIIKDDGAIVLNCSQPFTSVLITSNMSWYRYNWVWEKTVASNFAQAKKQPLRKHEDIAVFYYRQPTYNPQMMKGRPYTDNRSSGSRRVLVGVADTKHVNRIPIVNAGTRYPSSVQKFSNGNYNRLHPFQKPEELMELMILTYTNECDTVLDNVMGSGTTGVVCVKNRRNFIGMEIDEKYFDIAYNRIESVM